MAFEFDWVDAFSSRAFGGNGCAVVYDADGLDDATCRALVLETGLVECTFLGSSDTADIRVRYFLASREIPFAGHPTIATVASLVERGVITRSTAVLETGAGPVPVEVDRRQPGAPKVTMTQPRPAFDKRIGKALVAAVGGLAASDIAAEPQIVSTGLPFCITLLNDHDGLARAKLDTDALEAFRRDAGGPDADIMEPFWVALGGATGAGATYARLLLAPPNPPEDPFTGSATGAMAAYLWSRGLIDTPRLIAEQGHGMGRPGSAEVEVLGPRDDIAGVRVGGHGYVLMRGQLFV